MVSNYIKKKSVLNTENNQIINIDETYTENKNSKTPSVTE